MLRRSVCFRQASSITRASEKLETWLRPWLSTERRRSWLPLFDTDQDKAFLEAVRITRHSGKLHVLHQFRGSRKSWTARRCADRSAIFPYFYPRMRYIDAQKLSEEEVRSKLDGVEKEEKEFTFFYQVTRLVLDAVAVALISAVLYLGPYCYGVVWATKPSTEKTTEGPNEEQKERASFLDGLVKSIDVPSKSAILCSVLSLVVITFRMLLRRRAVIILDDPVGAVGRSFERTPATPRQHLEWISTRGHTCRILMLTSNDGIDACFQDVARGKREFIRNFPVLNAASLLPVLHDRTDIVDITQNCLPELKLDHCKRAFESQLLHHAASIRWWQSFAFVHQQQLDRVLDPANFEALASSRALLWEVAFMLDLQAEPTFRAQALAHSQRLTADDEQKLRKIFKNDDLQLKGVPRRLALATALVETADVKKEGADLARLIELLEKADRADDIETRGEYQRSLLPIVRQAEKKLEAAGGASKET